MEYLFAEGNGRVITGKDKLFGVSQLAKAAIKEHGKENVIKNYELVDDNVLDSFDIITIVGEINATFDININVGDLTPENFNSADAIWEVIQKYLNE